MHQVIQLLFVIALGSTSVTFRTYTTSDCSGEYVSHFSQSGWVAEIVADTNVECNATPDSSISNLVCYSDKITYTNHPNSNDCSSQAIENELPVGVCTEFPGPVPTWKYIDALTYDCGQSISTFFHFNTILFS